MTTPRRIAFEEMIRFDRKLCVPPVRRLAGVDEAGRGALAGPVVAAAVMCEPCEALSCVRDSKLVGERERERLHDLLLERSTAWGIGIVEPEEIDRTNILRATLTAMCAAVESLGRTPDLVLVDGNRAPKLAVRGETIPGGDRKSFIIAAASIIAKVTRDRIMRERACVYRGYGFTTNKGYGTREHIAAIRRKGRTEIHRMSFRVREQMRMDFGGGRTGKR
jgi:ribonuclease HII